MTVVIDDERLLETVRWLVRHESFSGTPGERELAEAIHAEMLDRGLRSELVEVAPGRFACLAVAPGTAGGSAGGAASSLMLNGHIDTNMPGVGWTVDPLGADVMDGYVYGIGVSNMKASVACMIEAVTVIHEQRLGLPGDVLAALVVGELQGGVGTLGLLDHGVRASHFIVGEPTDLQVMTVHSGTVECRIDVVGRSRHMSKLAEGVNAVLKMADVLGAVATMDFPRQNGRHTQLQRVNVGSIVGGMGETFADWRAPLVPDRCRAKLALRFPPGQSEDDAVAQVREVVERLQQADPELSATVTMSDRAEKIPMPAFEVDESNRLVRSLVAAQTRLGAAPQVGAVEPYAYYGTDAGHLARAGMTSGAVYGPGGGFNTMADERVLLDDIYTAARVFTAVATDVCAGWPR